MERILNNQIRDHVNEFNILPPCQSGFRPGYSCTTALLGVTDDIINATDEGKTSALVLIDYSKAFDRLNHELLISILNYIGFHTNAIKLLKSYLTNRSQYVETSSGVSPASTQLYGVPQGSILGPLLFSIYTCNITNSVKHCKVYLYADDTQVFASFFPNDINTAQNIINQDLDRLLQFSTKHNLIINASKSTFLLFGKHHDILHQNINIRIGADNVPYSKTGRNLGLIFDSELRFKPHISKCIQVAYSNLKKIFPHRHLLSKKDKIMLTDSLVLSHFNFADVVYGPCLTRMDSDRVQRVQKACLRLICGIRRREPVSHKLKEINWLSMDLRRKLHSAVLFHKIISSD